MSLSLKKALDHRNKRGLRSEETTALESHQTYQGTASWVISSHAEELRVLHHWAFLPLELDSVDPTDATKLDPPSPDTHQMATGRPTGTTGTGTLPAVEDGTRQRRRPKSWLGGGRGKVLQTLYLLSVTCLLRGMRLVSLCTAGWLLKSGFLVVFFIRHTMTPTTIQAIKKTPMQ